MHTPEERQIFRYSNGVKTVCADPAVLYRRFLKAIGGEQHLTDVEKQIQSGDETLAEQGSDKLLAAVRASFNLKSLDEEGEGATEPEQLRAYFSFLEFLTESKKKAETSPTWQPPMGEQSSAALAESTTALGSPSGSIAVGSSSNKRA